MAFKTTLPYKSLKFAKIKALILAGLTFLSIGGLTLIFTYQDSLQNPKLIFAVMTIILIVIGIIVLTMKFQQDFYLDKDKVRLVKKFGPFKYDQFRINKSEIKLEITQDEFKYYIANFILSDGTRIRIDRTPTKDRILEMTNPIEEVLR